MSILARHRYMISRIAEAFGFSNDEEVERMFLEPECLADIDSFFSIDGPTKIMIILDVEKEME